MWCPNSASSSAVGLEASCAGKSRQEVEHDQPRSRRYRKSCDSATAFWLVEFEGALKGEFKEQEPLAPELDALGDTLSRKRRGRNTTTWGVTEALAERRQTLDGYKGKKKEQPEGDAGKHTGELQGMCRALGLKVGGKKAELVQRLAEARAAGLDAGAIAPPGVRGNPLMPATAAAAAAAARAGELGGRVEALHDKVNQGITARAARAASKDGGKK